MADQKDEAQNSEDNPLSREDALLQTAKERFNLASEAEAKSRKEELDDQRFMIGEQWPLDIRNQRLQDARPCLTINRIPQFVRQVTNDQRQNRPAIKVNPVDDKADIETAKIFQGILRHIEYNSHSDIAIDTAFDWAAKSGLGYFRLITKYSSPLSFQQEIFYESIEDRFSVYSDPFSKKPDGSDSEWALIFEDMSDDEFKAQYPSAKLSTMSDWESLGDFTEGWVTREGCRVAEYYYKIYEEADLVKLSSGESVLKDDLPKELPENIRIVSERKTLIPKVKWAKINGIEILEETDIPGDMGWIPIIPVIGERSFIDGKSVYSGIIRNAKDPQRMYNFWKSAQTELIALAPKSPIIGYAGQFEGFEDKWKTANIKNHAYLEVNPTAVDGKPAPLPQRQNYEPPVQAISVAAQQAGDDLKSTTGIYDTELGNKSNEISGTAIQRRNVQSQTSNFHFMDNLSRSLRHAGRIQLDWIPDIYDTAEVVRIIGEDGTIDKVTINQIFQENGETKSYFLNHGMYDATVDIGPSFQTKRQEAVASMLDLTRAVPQAMQMALDLLVRNMDWPGSQDIADRIKKTLPPNITSDDKDQTPVPPQIQQKIAQMSQMIQVLTKELNDNTEIIKSKSLELASKERISTMESQNNLVLELLKHNAKDGQIAFLEEMKLLHKRLDMLGVNQPIDPNMQNYEDGGPAALSSIQPQPTGGTTPGQPMGV